MKYALILVLIISLVSVHAFVKRDTEPKSDTTPDVGSIFDDFEKSVDNLLQNFRKNLNESLNLDQLPEKLKGALDDVKKNLEGLQNTPKA